MDQIMLGKEVVCIGRVLMDIIVKEVDALPSEDRALALKESFICAGGSAANTATALSSLNIPTAVVASVGDDLLGHLLKRDLERHNIAVDLAVCKHMPTSFCFVLINHKGVARYLYNNGADIQITATDLWSNAFDRLLDGQWLRHIHIGGLNLLGSLAGDALSQLLLKAKKRNSGITISADTSKVPDNTARNRAACAHLDVLFCTAAEAYAMTKKHTIPDLARALLDWGPKMVVLKLGEKGSCICRPDLIEPLLVQTYEVQELTHNLNGAGDLYAAVFIGKLIGSQARLHVDEIKPDTLVQWAEEATDYAVQFLTTPRLQAMRSLGRFSALPEHQSIPKTSTTTSAIVLPIEHCFETNEYNRTAMNEATVPSDCQEQIAQTIEKRLPFSTLCDLCCGGAWLPIRLANLKHTSLKLVLCDKHDNQLRLARLNVQEHLRNIHGQPEFYPADALDTGLAAGFADLVTLSFAIHLFDEEAQGHLVREVHRICVAEGYFAILTFAPEAIQQTLFHTYIKGFSEIDAQRYVELDKLTRIVSSRGFRVMGREKFRYQRTFENVEAFMDHAQKRPFSTFYLLESQCGREEVVRRMDACKTHLRNKYGDGPVINESEVTLLLFAKEASYVPNSHP
jgi:fructokinase